MSISVIFAIKNGLRMGYCFWESLQSCLPICDELIISDGFSNDGTYEALLKFKEKYCKDIPTILYQDEWEEKSYHGEVIARVSQRTIEKATKEYVYYLQADEILPESVINHIKGISGYNSVSFTFNHFIRSLRPSVDGYKDAIRMVKRESAKLRGDAWTFEPVDPVCSSNLCPKPICHFAWIFPKNNDVKDIEHSKIYSNFPCYQEKMKNAIKIMNEAKVPYPMTDFDDFPDLARRFLGEVEYKLPEDI